MDVIKQKKKRYWENSKLLYGAVFAVAAISIYLLLNSSSKGRAIQQDQIVVSAVKQGSMEVTVEGFGVLRSHKQALITSQTDATVKQILLRPGVRVSEDSIILELVNPILEQEVEREIFTVKQEKANLVKLELANSRELLREKAATVELESELEIAKLRMEAQQQLYKDGIVSALDFKAIQVHVKQKSRQLKLHIKRQNQLEKESEISEQVQKEQINIAQTRYESALEKQKKLTVKAGIAGVLQRLPVELGQNITPGQELALIGSESDLVALIQIPQSKVEQVSVGQPASINLQSERSEGQVTRITPEVRDGTVEVEISFTNNLPGSTRPELNVDATIYIARLSDVLYIERPFNALTNSTFSVFKLQDDKAVRQQMQFGQGSGRYIQVVSGATVNDRIIISNMSNYSEETELTLIN